ncbi:ThuA domain-containing protein [Paenibacillus sp. P96]|uniref:ThuA domain-containing protein n=1 Tax=Paenibacillus zeirhizosphaerae TaxID=2987519 RepID=A0ABT9FN60_9BACL|nr:ThuA domain-containing protein [Paenibacillus sp. P96]MDP4096148.1 ThuA domain-containing protein [Paenibacillus sp. P96]
MEKRKALLLGDYTYPEFHPLQEIDKEVTHILHDWMTVQCSENRKLLLKENISSFDLCISYGDNWKELMSPQQTAGLLAYVSGGGGLLVLHNGISMHNNYEIAQLIGAKFTRHPAYAPLQFKSAAPDHPVMEGIVSFAMEEEPYRFEFDPFTPKTVLLEYELDGEVYPAAWAHSYGLGRVVYLMPGHHQPTFQNVSFQRLIVQAAKWAARLPG